MIYCVLCPQDFDHWHGVWQHCGIQHRLQPLALRTPEQVLRTVDSARKRTMERGEEVMHSAVYLQHRGNYRFRDEGKTSTGP